VKTYKIEQRVILITETLIEAKNMKDALERVNDGEGDFNEYMSTTHHGGYKVTKIMTPEEVEEWSQEHYSTRGIYNQP